MAEMRVMTAAELETALGWAAEEGWNPGHDDAAAFRAADPEGFFVALADGTPVAAISVVNHAPDMAFLGLYLCRPEWRGRGIGLRLWQHALDHAGPRTVGLDGVPAQQANYARSGFVKAGETRRFAGPVPARPAAGVRRANPADLPAMLALEEAACGYAKAAFLSAWLVDAPGRRSLVLERGGIVAGMATLRRCREGVKIGPLVAPDMDGAEALLGAAAAEAAAAGWDGPAILDVPDGQAGLTALCRRLGMGCSFVTARMYRGAPPRPSPGLVTAVATLELG